MRGGAVIFQQKNGLDIGECTVELHQIFDIRASPGVDGLVWIADNKEVLVVAAEHLHQFILQAVNILEFINHDVFQPLLPFQPGSGTFLENVQGKFNQVIVVQPEAFLLLVQVAVKDDIGGVGCRKVFLPQDIRGHFNQIDIIIRVFE